MSSNILTFNAYSGIDPSIMQIHNEMNVYYFKILSILWYKSKWPETQMLRFYAYFGINPSSVVQFRMYPVETEFLRQDQRP